MFAGYAGVYGDRLFAFTSSASPKGFPFFTGREQRQMLRYQPRFRNPEKATRPINQMEADSLPPGVTPLYANPDDLMVDVETPAGKTVAIDDPVIDLCRAIGEKTWRRNGDKNRQAPVPGQRLFGFNFFRRLRRERIRRTIFAHRIESCRVGPGTRPALRDDHARSRHCRKNDGDIETSRASSRRNGRRLWRRARRRNDSQRRSSRIGRLTTPCRVDRQPDGVDTDK